MRTKNEKTMSQSVKKSKKMLIAITFLIVRLVLQPYSLDAIEPASVKFCEDGGDMVRIYIWRHYQIPQSGTRIGVDNVMPSAFVRVNF